MLRLFCLQDSGLDKDTPQGLPTDHLQGGHSHWPGVCHVELADDQSEASSYIFFSIRVN